MRAPLRLEAKDHSMATNVYALELDIGVLVGPCWSWHAKHHCRSKSRSAKRGRRFGLMRLFPSMRHPYPYPITFLLLLVRGHIFTLRKSHVLQLRFRTLIQIAAVYALPCVAIRGDFVAALRKTIVCCEDASDWLLPKDAVIR